MVEVSAPQTPTFDRRAPNYDIVLSSAAELGQSSPVAQLAAEALVDSLPSLKRDYPTMFEAVATADDLKGILHDGVTCAHVGESSLLTLSYTHPSARFAMMGATALSDAFIEFNVSTRRNSRAVEYYSDQIAAAEVLIDSLMVIRTQILDATGMIGMQADLKMTFNQIRALEGDYFKARSVREGIESKINAIRDAVAEDPDFVPSITNTNPGSMNRLKGELDLKLAELATLRQRYTDDSHWISRTQRQTDALRAEIARERDHYIRSLEIELAEARSVEQSLQASHELQMEDVAAYPGVRNRIETLDLRIDGLQRLLQNLEVKRGEVRMAADTDIRISNVLLIEEPSLDVPVGRGRRFLYLAISILLAATIGLVAAFFVESNDHRIYDRRRAEMYLEVPVLGSLPDATAKPRY
jgi:uncharacterized protein involved in exopolysaccharide biosynthesis